MEPRQPDLVGKTFRDEDGELLEGQYILTVPSKTDKFASERTEYLYHEGKIHGKPAIIYYDGLQENWENGKFIEVRNPPFHERD